ncbi:MAG TPA: hypothetical protein VF753_17505 [Terriglobales bacterium]
MPNTSKSSKKASSGAAKTEFVDFSTPLYRSSVACVAELQKNSLDAAAEQASEWVAAGKKACGNLPVAAPTFFFDMFGLTMRTIVETQKNMIDLAVEQSQSMSAIAKQRTGEYSKITEGVANTFRATVARSVETQKKALEFAGAQSKAFCETTRKQMGNGPASAMVESFEQGTNTMIEAQESILSAITKPFAVAANA